MGIFDIFFKKNETAKQKTGGMEDFMTLIRVYFQASIASNLGISNLTVFPELRTFKQSLHVPTQNNKLGLAEKSVCRKMLKDIYNLDDNFCKEIDGSVRKNCKKLQDVQTYMIQFQGFSQELMMLMSNLMKFKLRVPVFMRKALYSMTEKSVDDIFNKNDFRDMGVVKSVASMRQYSKRLGFSQKWITDFAYQVIMLAKKEPKPDSSSK
jgi:hypothetical protein